MRLVVDKEMLEKLPEIEDLAGIFEFDAKKVTKNMTLEEIVSAEKKAIEGMWISRFKK